MGNRQIDLTGRRAGFGRPESQISEEGFGDTVVSLVLGERPLTPGCKS
jgi:hypothetical protein